MSFLCRRRAALGAGVAALTTAIVLSTGGIAAACASQAPTAESDPSSTAGADPAAESAAPASAASLDPSASSAATDSTDAGAQAGADPAVPAAGDPSETAPQDTTSQDTVVENTQTGVANTGANAATGAGGSGGTTSGATPGNGSSSVTTGAATAVGGDTHDSITQQAAAVVTGAARIVITQMALIVNIGLAAANSGANAAANTAGDAGGSSPGATSGPGVSLVQTGDASVTGLSGSTAVTQVVDLLDANDHTTQTAAVTNVGIGVANSGANTASGQMSSLQPDGTAVAVTWGPLDATVGTGSATATGDLSHTTIVQVAMGTAADDGTLTITQRAVVVNFGAAIANSGFDAAGGSPDSQSALLVRGIVMALLAMLAPDSPSTVVPPGTAAAIASSDGSAAVSTGSAVAIGNGSDTTVRQVATGSVSGSHHASAEQTAAVGNFGFAFANTGANTAGGTVGAAAGAQSSDLAAQLASLPSAFDGFLALLASPGDHGEWSANLQLGADLLAATAFVSAVESLFSLPGTTGDDAAQVVVRQITGILDLMIGVAVTGENVASTTDSPTPASPPVAAVVTSEAGAVEPVGAIVHTGDARVANVQTTVICQVINVSASVCRPPAEVRGEVVTRVPAVAAVLSEAVVAPVVAKAAPGARQLAFTGSSWTVSLAAIAALVLLSGALLLIVARRRRPLRPTP